MGGGLSRRAVFTVPDASGSLGVGVRSFSAGKRRRSPGRVGGYSTTHRRKLSELKPFFGVRLPQKECHLVVGTFPSLHDGRFSPETTEPAPPSSSPRQLHWGPFQRAQGTHRGALGPQAPKNYPPSRALSLGLREAFGATRSLWLCCSCLSPS